MPPLELARLTLGGATMAQVRFTASRVSTVIVLLLGVGIDLFVSSRQRSGLPVPLSSVLLADLPDRPVPGALHDPERHRRSGHGPWTIPAGSRSKSLPHPELFASHGVIGGWFVNETCVKGFRG